MPSYGLIVEGANDGSVFPCLARRTNSPDASIYCIECEGVTHLMKNFPALLRRFEHVHNGGPVAKAIVIRDRDRKNTEQVLEEMRGKVQGRRYPFPIGFCVISRETETLFLADVAAIQSVSNSRGGGRVTPVNEVLDNILDAKGRFRSLLSAARLTVARALYEQIAEELNLEALRARVPTFNQFEHCVLDL